MNKKEGMMVVAVVVTFIGFFVWYGSGSKSMYGQSGNWSAEYVGHEENSVIYREFTLTYSGEEPLDSAI